MSNEITHSQEAYLEQIPLVAVRVRHKSCLFLTPSGKRCQYIAMPMSTT